MIKINYWCGLFDNHLPHLFTLCKGDLDGFFYICVGPKLVAVIDKVKDNWQQISGDEMPDEFIEHFGKFIDGELPQQKVIN